MFPTALIFNNYGCAEAMPRLTVRKSDDSVEAADIGRPLPGVTLSLNPKGILHFRSEYSAVAFIDEFGFRRVEAGEWISTGDLAEEFHGDQWRILGRAGEVFKRYGEKISLANLLKSAKSAWPFEAAFYRDSDLSGEEAHVLVLSPHPDALQLREILKKLRGEFPRAHWPLRIESTSELPTLPNGKIDLRRLADASDKKEQWRQRL